MKQIPSKYLEAFIAACRQAASAGLVRASSGNLSWRVDDDHMLITETGSWMSKLTEEQVVVCRIADNVVLNNKRPSEEIGFHLGIMRKRAGVHVVLHFQSPCATALACRPLEQTDFCVIPEVPYHIGPIAVLPYLAPGSDQLAEAVVSAMTDHDLVILKNHGQVVMGKDFDNVIQKATFFELACDIILRVGDEVQTLSAEAVEALFSRHPKE